ncbi:MAG TPA: glycosyltransferase family 2 protein, partial [Tepidisphaeraceae bacterium]|nr:glycosyltransferase family 2 protein [Tepidisphaeraceae bacterium]
MNADQAIRVSIIIPVFNKAALTRACLDTILRDPPAVSHEIIVCDDASTDETSQLLAERAEQVRSIRNRQNRGFALTCNAGAAIARGAALLFLNNDTIPQRGWLDTLVAYADQHPKAAVVGAKMLFPDQTVQHCGVVVCQDRIPRHIYAGFPGDHPAVNKSRRFQVVTAGCALIRKSAFDEMRGFDSAYHNGFEDVDLCLRLGEAGYEVHYCHEAVLYHLESVSRDIKLTSESKNRQLYLSRWNDRVGPDDIQYYLDDKLLDLTYYATYPFQLSMSPDLGVLKASETHVGADEILNRRARQIFNLLRDNVRLNLSLIERNASQGNGNSAAKIAGTPRLPRLVRRGKIQWLCKQPTRDIISILIPVKNGARELREVLPRILQQQVRD